MPPIELEVRVVRNAILRVNEGIRTPDLRTTTRRSNQLSYAHHAEPEGSRSLA